MPSVTHLLVYYDLMSNDATKLTASRLQDMEEQNFFSSKDYEWEGTAMLTKLCLKLGYSCDESKGVFID